jgi:hypothetical protein
MDFAGSAGRLPVAEGAGAGAGGRGLAPRPDAGVSRPPPFRLSSSPSASVAAVPLRSLILTSSARSAPGRRIVIFLKTLPRLTGTATRNPSVAKAP